ncbi:unnamed protein product [Hymenolepis diminuta]|uniref:ANK_REP_REGION domain-containing protein n=1 Tax=Hymenolepis diminuta TaxID=6216 RepID=A0A0R3SL75_HYMDI|nr:unnamed protein product [Hymenolepis diminuta]
MGWSARSLFDAIAQNDVNPSFFPDFPTTTPIIMAVRAKFYNIIILLLQYGADLTRVDVTGQNALHHAVRCKDMISIRLLLSHNCPTEVRDNSGFTPFILAISSNSLSMVHYFVQKGAAVYPEHGSVQTMPLVSAAYFGYLKILDYLLKVEEPNKLKKKIHINYALCMACCRGQIDSAKMLIESGALVTRYYLYDISPLTFAIIYNQEDIVSLLLSNGAPVNDQDYRGYTPLMFSVMFDNPSVVSKLLWHGANPDTAAKDGQTTAETIAINMRRETIWRMLYTWKQDVVPSVFGL